jgi:rubrerythrin
MIYPEQLSLEHQEKLTALIQKFMKEEMRHDNPFYLCIIAKEGRSLFSDYLKQQTYRRVVRDQLFLSPNKVS